MLGTGHATVTHCYNTCFILQTASTRLLVDAGGGNGILAQLNRLQLPITSLHHLFVTHAHTDHILGTIWVLRMVASAKTYDGTFQVYTHDKAALVMRTVVEMTFSQKHLERVSERVVFHTLKDGDVLQAGDIRLKCFDIHSTKEKQFGFRATLPSGLVVACLGDEPYNAANRTLVLRADWLMCEAFCLYADRERFRPYEKCHSTALDAGRTAAELDVRGLILYHTEDSSLPTRRQTYTHEAAQHFGGRIIVPDDLECIYLALD